jgi:hypothetical protein
VSIATEEREKKWQKRKKQIKKFCLVNMDVKFFLKKQLLKRQKIHLFPNDAYLIWYLVNEEYYVDLTRCGKKSRLFDMYYDTYGPGAVQRIDFGYGRVNPRLWGYQKTEKRKRK